MNLLRAALESPLVNRIGWTLLHFLWEGAVAAALLAVVLAILRGRSAAVRYLASCAGLVVLRQNCGYHSIAPTRPPGRTTRINSLRAAAGGPAWISTLSQKAASS